MPTARQRKAAKATVENMQLESPKPAGEVLKSVGYGTGLQNQPKRVLESEGFKEALHELIPDELLKEKHLELLNKQQVVVRNNVTTGEIEVIPTGEIDVQAVTKALDMAYKLKGSYAPEKTTNMNLNIEAKTSTNEELENIRKSFNEKAREAIINKIKQ